jgi:hypothetical protein
MYLLLSGLLSGLVLGLCPGLAQGQTNANGAKSAAPATAEERDGSHDFDFLFGRWKSHQRRLLHPLTGANDWAEFDATLMNQPYLDGSANVDQLEADTPTGHLLGLTVRTYNPKSHQWSIYWRTGLTE